MKKITALLLCFLLLCACSVSVLTSEVKDETTSTVISATVPDTHKITVVADEALVFYKGISADEFDVERLSEPRLLVRAESGSVIKAVMLNEIDVTDQLHGGYIKLSPVYEDKTLTVITESESSSEADSYTVKGRVTLNGEPLSGVTLELRSTLKTTETDDKGCFVFTDVETGMHSLTALKDGRVIGYLSFELIEDEKADVSLLENGTYTVRIDKDSAGVELHLMLNEDEGTLTPTKVQGVDKAEPDSPQTGDTTGLLAWGLLLILSTACLVVLENYRRRIKAD